VRIEVGYGLEDRLTDAESRIIIEQVILPRFRQGDFSDATLEGAAAIVRVLGGRPASTDTAPLTRTANQRVDQRLVDPDAALLVMAFLGGLVMLLSIRGILAHQPRKTPTSRNEGWGESSSDSSGGGGGSSGGSDFSGGGGSFGGGGASGSW
jgi:uncharacterized protein